MHDQQSCDDDAHPADETSLNDTEDLLSAQVALLHCLAQGRLEKCIRASSVLLRSGILGAPRLVQMVKGEGAFITACLAQSLPKN